MASTRVVRKVKVEGKWQFLPVTRFGVKLDWGKLDLHGTPICCQSSPTYEQLAARRHD